MNKIILIFILLFATSAIAEEPAIDIIIRNPGTVTISTGEKPEDVEGVYIEPNGETVRITIISEEDNEENNN